MEAHVYSRMEDVEATHWWFVGRRRLFRRYLRQCGLCPASRVLDIGAGTGGTLQLLAEMGHTGARGVDSSALALAACARKGLGDVGCAALPDLPFGDGSFDIVLATDVIEHVADDAAACAEIGRLLAPGGRAILTVPAFPSLWGLQDEVSGHHRRYRMQGLRSRVTAAGLVPREAFHFNYLLFPAIFLARRLLRTLRPPVGTETEINTPAINALLKAIFAVDVATAPLLHPPFGVSIFMLAERPDATARRVPGG